MTRSKRSGSPSARRTVTPSASCSTASTLAAGPVGGGLGHPAAQLAPQRTPVVGPEGERLGADGSAVLGVAVAHAPHPAVQRRPRHLVRHVTGVAQFGVPGVVDTDAHSPVAESRVGAFEDGDPLRPAARRRQCGGASRDTAADDGDTASTHTDSPLLRVLVPFPDFSAGARRNGDPPSPTCPPFPAVRTPAKPYRGGCRACRGHSPVRQAALDARVYAGPGAFTVPGAEGPASPDRTHGSRRRDAHEIISSRIRFPHMPCREMSGCCRKGERAGEWRMPGGMEEMGDRPSARGLLRERRNGAPRRRRPVRAGSREVPGRSPRAGSPSDGPPGTHGRRCR